MFEALFGAEMPLALRFFFAFLVVLGLIGISAYLVRRFGSTRFGGSAAAARGRQPRLGVIETAAVDGKRQLMLIRRDNTEHLLLIGGPTDVVVEPNIVRAAPATSAREAPAVRTANGDMMPRQAPTFEPTPWPLQPEPASRAARPAAIEESEPWPVQHEPAPPPLPPAPAPRTSPAADPLAGLAADLSRVNTASEFNFTVPPQRATPAMEPAPRAPQPQRAAPAVEPAPMRAAPQQPAPAAAPVSADQNLADMAQRLEAALRRPNAAGGEARPSDTSAKPARSGGTSIRPSFAPDFSATGSGNTKPSAEPARAGEPKPARADGKPGPSKAAYDNLEQEMANLLHRPQGKS